MSIPIKCSICTLMNEVDNFEDPKCTLCESPLPIPSDEIVTQYILAQQRKKRIQDNKYLAYQFIPESFLSSPSIIVTGTINNVPVKFLIDTGAQISVLPLHP